MYQNSVSINRSRPIVTYVTIGILAVAYVLDAASSFLISSADLGLLSFYGMKINEYIIGGQLWRLITPNLFHSGMMHIASNCLGLFIWGRFIEAFYGRGRFIVIMVLSGLMCVAFSFAFSSAASLGASGVVFGLYGAIIGIHKYDKSFFNAVFGIELLVFIGITVFLGFMRPYVDNYGHMGGLAGGFLASRAVCLLFERKPMHERILYGAVFVLLYAACLYIGVRGFFN